jgi:ABC-type glycerol-3-phosphate transport system permease component
VTRSLVVHFVLSVLAAVALLPLFWLACATFKATPDLTTHIFLPWGDLGRLTGENYARLFTQQPFGTWLVNSLFLSSLHTVLVVALSSLGGFALAKYRFRGKRLLMLVMLGVMMLPGQVLLPSSYELMEMLGWIDSFLAIVIPGSVSVFGMFLFMQAMQSVPDELIQAARVDGCSELHIWWEVALPIVRPMLGAFTLMAFLGSWNSFLWPQVVLQDERKYTLPIGLANMLASHEYQTDYGVLLAGTLLAVAPVVVLFFVLQRDFVAGLASGAVKW